ncbi:hypothetical protein [Sphingopyxis sp.]|uniref:hypothetical protein n=1 Tax=Sphingopyxis sp. TaxID=1908224 RepID=UPI003D6D69C1
MNNWDVRGGVSDFWAYIRAPRPHRWAFWVATIAATLAIFYGIAENIVRTEEPKAQIIYFESWTAGRTADEVGAGWIERAKEVNRANALRRAEYQKLADRMGVDYDSSEADKETRETLGTEADTIVKKSEPPQHSTLADRAARGPKAEPTTPAPPAPTAR